MLPDEAVTAICEEEVGGRLRTVYRSPTLRIAAAASEEVRSVIGSLGARIAQRDIRYYLSAGTDRFERPPWGFGERRAGGGPPRIDESTVESILRCREERVAAIEQEVGAVESWFADGVGASKGLVMEVIGSPSHDDIAFWQACSLRLARRSVSRPPMVVVRHAAHAEADAGEVPAGRQADEILLALLLSGGYAWKPEFGRWSALRQWDHRLIAALTSVRVSEQGKLYTYAGSRQRSRAWAAYKAAEQAVVAELAAMVVSAQRNPLLATAALVEDPELSFAAFSVPGCAETVGSRQNISLYGRNLFRHGWNHRWTGITKGTAATLCLAAIVVDRGRMSPATAGAVISLAERFEVDTSIRSQFAYALGQTLVRDTGAERWAAGMRCFEYARTCLQAKRPVKPEVDASRMAAAYNGTALACYRTGDRRGAVEAELAALDALAAPGGIEKSRHLEQEILLLTNLARVYSRSQESQGKALNCYRQAWQIASNLNSLSGIAYVVPGLVPTLIGVGEYAEAERVTRDLLRRYDAEAAPSRDLERAVAAACWNLADAKQAEGAVRVAAAWYAEAVHRMRRAAPEVIDRIIQNLRRHQEDPPDSVVGLLTKKLTAHIAMAADLRALLDLLEEGGQVD